MKNQILLLLSFVTCLSFGQNRIKFRYDSAGNQIQRYICINCITAKTYANSEFKTPETIVEKDLIEDEENDHVSYYPNPVREELYVKWKNKDNVFVTSIEIFSISGQLVSSYPKLNNVDTVSIAFQSFPEGIYNLILVYSNSERKTLKIVKN